jgi:predicted house-cleaning noncanonical NTP pyrophosphatase (MazG superfamily)
MQKRYGRLVRDNIPAIIRANGEMPTTRLMETDEYRRELLYLLIEEAENSRQAADMDKPNLTTELADVLEVLYAILEEFEIPADELERIRRERAEKRGQFKEKIFLESVG